MKINKNYFNALGELKHFSTNPVQKNCLAILTLASYLTIVVPLAVGLSYGILSLVSRVRHPYKDAGTDSIYQLASKQMEPSQDDKQLKIAISQTIGKLKEAAAAHKTRALQSTLHDHLNASARFMPTNLSWTRKVDYLITIAQIRLKYCTPEYLYLKTGKLKKGLYDPSLEKEKLEECLVECQGIKSSYEFEHLFEAHCILAKIYNTTNIEKRNDHLQAAKNLKEGSVKYYPKHHAIFLDLRIFNYEVDSGLYLPNSQELEKRYQKLTQSISNPQETEEQIQLGKILLKINPFYAKQVKDRLIDDVVQLGQKHAQSDISWEGLKAKYKPSDWIERNISHKADTSVKEEKNLFAMVPAIAAFERELQQYSKLGKHSSDDYL